MEPKQQNRTNGRKTTNDALTTLLRAGVIATTGLVLGAGMTTWVVDDDGADRVGLQTAEAAA